jgi:hypothetical protein
MKKLVCTIVLMFLAAAPGLAGVVISLSDDFPEVGNEQVVGVSGVTGSGECRLWVVYSPTSQTQEEAEVGRVPESGEVRWTPARPGIATLSVRDDGGSTVASRNVAILFSSTPRSGLLVMVLAGALLFGGAGVSLWWVLREGVVPS